MTDRDVENLISFLGSLGILLLLALLLYTSHLSGKDKNVTGKNNYSNIWKNKNAWDKLKIVIAAIAAIAYIAVILFDIFKIIELLTSN